MVPYETIEDLADYLGVPELTGALYENLWKVKSAVNDPRKMASFLNLRVCDSACMTAILTLRRTHTRHLISRTVDARLRMVVAAFLAVSDTNAHVDPAVLEEFKTYLYGVARVHMTLYVRAGYDLSPASIVVILLCTMHDYLFVRNLTTVSTMLLCEHFVSVCL